MLVSSNLVCFHHVIVLVHSSLISICIWKRPRLLSFLMIYICINQIKIFHTESKQLGSLPSYGVLGPCFVIRMAVCICISQVLIMSKVIHFFSMVISFLCEEFSRYYSNLNSSSALASKPSRRPGLDMKGKKNGTCNFVIYFSRVKFIIW